MRTTTDRPESAGEPVTTAGCRAPSDIPRDILATAVRPGLGAPATIHVHPELHAQLLAQGDRSVFSDHIETGATGATGDIPLVVDDDIPAVPGFEVHRGA